MKINRPFGGAPRKEVLEKNRRGDEQPARPDQRQCQKGQEQGPKKIAMGERDKKRVPDPRGMGDGIDQNVARGAA